MKKLITIVMYLLWTISLIGLLVITFTNFKYPDLNSLVIIVFFFTAVNTAMTVGKK